MKKHFIVYIGLALCLVTCKNNEKKKEETYVKSSEKEIANKGQNTSEGKKLYQDFCVQCHLPTGKGIPNMYPPLRNSDWLTDKREESIHAVKYGLQGEITVNGKTYDNIMTPLGLEDQEIADVMNYIMNAWGNKQDKPVTAEEVKQIQE